MRVLVISHAMVQGASRARWRRLAERHPVEVTLLVPASWRTTWFGEECVWTPEPVQDGRFRVMPVSVTDPSNWSRYLLRSLDAHLREIRPDVIYVVQEESTFVLQQVLLYRSLWARRAKLLFFSWNNVAIGDRTWRSRLLWRRVCSRCDAAIGGNREVERVLRGAGFTRPVYVQTEIGIDEDIFRPDSARREEMRARLGLDGFVVGFAGRVTEAKGVTDLARAMEGLPGRWTLLLIGDGDLREPVESRARTRGWGDRLRVTGQVDIAEMPQWFQPLDCLVLPSRTTPGWKEQFGLVLAQAMACRVPVIGSDSGAIPEVIGDAGLVFPEGDVAALRACLVRLMEDPARREDLAAAGYRRCLAHFASRPLADETYELFGRLLGQGQAPIALGEKA